MLEINKDVLVAKFLQFQPEVRQKFFHFPTFPLQCFTVNSTSQPRESLTDRDVIKIAL